MLLLRYDQECAARGQRDSRETLVNELAALGTISHELYSHEKICGPHPNTFCVHLTLHTDDDCT
jgi:hypothetical protein